MTCCRLKVVFFVLLNSLVPALVAAVVSFGSGHHVCTSGNSNSGSCQDKDVEIYPQSYFSLDCAENSACRGSRIVVGSGSTFTGDFVCGADGRPSYMSCQNADITFYATDVSPFKVRCQHSDPYKSCQETAFTMVDTNVEIVCGSGECQDMVVNVCADSHVHVSGGLDAGNPVVVNLYGVDATVGFDEAAEYYTISDFAADLCPVSHFTCNDGCEIVAGFLGDGICDCSHCEDEAEFNCTTGSGGCPVQCGQRNSFLNFECDDGCVIPDAFVDNKHCECPNCEDESNWDCDTCDCPICGGSFECFPPTTTTTLKPTTTTLTPTSTTATPTTTTLRPTSTTLTPTSTTLTPTSTTLTTTLKPSTTTSKPTTTKRKLTTTTSEPATATATVYPTTTTRKSAPTKTEDSSANPVTAACIWSWALILLLFIL